MTLSTRRRVPFAFLVLLLLSTLPGRSFALAEIEEVSKARAKELGITVLQKTRTDDVWVTVEFKATGRMKGFRWADLELTQGGKSLVSAALMPQKTAGETVRVQFYVAPGALADSIVTIFVYEGRGGIGYQLRMKDFAAPVASR